MPSNFETFRDALGRTHRMTGLCRDRDREHRDRTPEEQAQVDALARLTRVNGEPFASAADASDPQAAPTLSGPLRQAAPPRTPTVAALPLGAGAASPNGPMQGDRHL